MMEARRHVTMDHLLSSADEDVVEADEMDEMEI
jgi:hypothetical protein